MKKERLKYRCSLHSPWVGHHSCSYAACGGASVLVYVHFKAISIHPHPLLLCRMSYREVDGFDSQSIRTSVVRLSHWLCPKSSWPSIKRFMIRSKQPSNSPLRMAFCRYDDGSMEKESLDAVSLICDLKHVVSFWRDVSSTPFPFGCLLQVYWSDWLDTVRAVH